MVNAGYDLYPGKNFLLFVFLGNWEDKMEALANVNWEVILQLASVGLIVLAGPAVIFVLAFRGGDM
ncbi:hypothetical protein NIES267_68940 [Calothrix parasitica NIES-267]|uniref:Photosystem II reaction center protein Psb30 n=1 Tax=Calothrix parasitica NIES-267 TaxID=1973488 RepID=A0A1Z4M1L3_9CYAN|nr:hypothetical protein NIES267_68940 [Calothrix parasitica NIES-267]